MKGGKFFVLGMLVLALVTVLGGCENLAGGGAWSNLKGTWIRQDGGVRIKFDSGTNNVSIEVSEDGRWDQGLLAADCSWDGTELYLFDEWADSSKRFGLKAELSEDKQILTISVSAKYLDEGYEKYYGTYHRQ